MSRLAQTAGLTETQSEIVNAVREFVDKEIIPAANDLEHGDEYPEAIVEQMKQMGLFGLTIPEEYGGPGGSLLTHAPGGGAGGPGRMGGARGGEPHFRGGYMVTQAGT